MVKRVAADHQVEGGHSRQQECAALPGKTARRERGHDHQCDA